MANCFLRLDINQSGITAMIIELRHGKGYRLDNYSLLFDALPKNDDSTDLFTASMAVIANNLDINSCSKAIVLANSSLFFFRNISTPFLSEKKIEQILPCELEQVMPLSNVSYLHDFHRLTCLESSSRLLTASILESDIESFFSGLEPYGIKPVVVTSRAYAAAVSFIESQKELTNFVFLFLGRDETVAVLVKDGVPCHVRVRLSPQPGLEELGPFIKQALIGFDHQTGVDDTYTIVVCDENENVRSEHDIFLLESGFGRYAGLKELGQTVEPLRLNQTILPESLLDGILPDKNTAFLFNFCKDKFSTDSFLDTYATQLSSICILLAACFFLFIASINMDISALENQVAVLDNQSLAIFESTFSEKQVVDPYMQMKAHIQAALKKSNGKETNPPLSGDTDVKMLEIIDELSRKIDASNNLEISRLLYNNRQLILSGTTDNFNHVDSAKAGIESSGLFTKVTISSATAEKNGQQVTFKFIVEL